MVRALVFVFECFVFETTVNLPPSTTNQKHDPDPGSDMSYISGGLDLAQENPTSYSRDPPHFESNPCMNGHLTTVFYAQESHIPIHCLP